MSHMLDIRYQGRHAESRTLPRQRRNLADTGGSIQPLSPVLFSRCPVISRIPTCSTISTYAD